jgi:hypothetical protein
VRIDPAGVTGPTRGQARGRGWRFVGPALVVPTTAGTSPEQRIVEAHAVAGDRAVVTGWAALRLHGGGFFDGFDRDGSTRRPVPIAANGERLGSRDGIEVVRNTVPHDEVVVRHGIRCATVERALFDEMRAIGEVREMAVAVGAACAARLTTVERMRVYANTRRWYRDVRMVREAVQMSVAECRSPQEDRFRMLWEYDAGWGRPLINCPIHDRHGRFVAIPDLLDPRRGVVGEYAGAGHRDIEQHERDIAREAAIRDLGLEYVEVVARDLRHRDRVVRRMEAAASRARLLTPAWRLGPLE